MTFDQCGQSRGVRGIQRMEPDCPHNLAQEPRLQDCCASRRGFARPRGTGRHRRGRRCAHAQPAMDMGSVRFARGLRAVEEQRGATEAPALCVRDRGSTASQSAGNLTLPTARLLHDQRAQSRLLASGPAFARVPQTETRHQHPNPHGSSRFTLRTFKYRRKDSVPD